MTDNSDRLGLPYLQPSQAQKHVTHNEALRMLDLAVQLTIEEDGAETPPSAPEAGQIWALGPAPTGAWAGQAGRLAGWIDGAWAFTAPATGWRAYDMATGALRIWDGTGWQAPATEISGPVTELGIQTGADATNRLAVQSPASLFTHDGAGHQVKINKAGASDTAALLFQSGWTGHAEIGLAGDTDLSLKTSADGSAWSTALAAEAATGRVGFPSGITLGSGSDTLAVYEEGTWTPEIADAASGGNTGTATVLGSYTRIGRLVHVTLSASGIGTAGMTGGNPLYLRGLPYPAAAPASGALHADHLTFSGTPALYTDTGATTLRLRDTTSATSAAFLNVAALTSGSCALYGGITYIA